MAMPATASGAGSPPTTSEPWSGRIRSLVNLHDSQGSAYVFVRSGTTWSQEAKLTASDGAVFDWFGTAVALSGDTALVGAVWHTVGANYRQGSAYVFLHSGLGWSEQQELTVSDGAADDCFAVSLALDGDTALVGAYLRDVGANPNQGSAYVYRRSGTAWSEQTRLTAANGESPEDCFGMSVALDGDSALAGAVYDDIGVNVDQGSAYTFSGGARVTAAAPTPPANAAGWNRAAVMVTLTASDDIVGVDKTYYRLAIPAATASTIPSPN